MNTRAQVFKKALAALSLALLLPGQGSATPGPGGAPPRRLPRSLGVRTSAEAKSEAWTDEQFRSAASAIAGQIEELSGRSFLESVPLEVVDRSTFVSRLRLRQEQLHPAKDVGPVGTSAKLLGMLPGDLDLERIYSDISEQARGGFYDSTSGSLIILREFTGRFARVVMAHEYARALLEQHYDGSDELTGTVRNADQQLARHAVISGSCLAILGRWVEQNLPPLVPLDFIRFDSATTNTALDGAPPYVWRPAEGMARRGESFLRRTNIVDPRPSRASEADVSRALSDPPRSTEQLLHPVKYWKGARLDEPRQLLWEIDSLPQGWESRFEDTLGELYLGIMTLPPEQRTTRGEQSLLELLTTRFTTQAADGWDGDRYLLLQRGESCVLCLATIWDSAEDASEFHNAVVALKPVISGQKSKMDSFDHSMAGFRSEYNGGKRVMITSWNAVRRAEVDELLLSLRCVEII